ncbi:MAG: hypothetical protein JWM36_2928 [Hyphomicrobiales bacterium]|nr:hypothetical protein [Hyphomicrobiales bacterium]
MTSHRLLTILALLMAGQLTPARAAQQDCGSCTALDRATMADPVPPSDLPPPPAAHSDNQDAKGKPLEVPIPGQSGGVTVFHKSGSGVWLSEVAGGNVYVQPHQNKLSLDLKYGF